MRLDRFLIILSALATATLSGCSGSGRELVPVAGKITFEGRNAPGSCRVYFLPQASEGPIRPSVAETTEDGAYEVISIKDAKGLLPGAYQVNVVYLDLKPGANPALDGSWIEHKHDAGQLVVESGSDAIEHNITIPKKS